MDPAEVPRMKSASERSSPASANPARIPDSHATKTGPPPPNTSARVGMEAQCVFRPSVELDARAHRIQDERDLQAAELRHLAISHIERHALSLQVLAECVQPFDLETDVVERTAFRRRGRGVGLAKIHFAARHERGQKVAALAWLRAKGLDVPGAEAVYIGSGDMDVVKRDRHLQGRVLGELDAHLFGKFRDELLLFRAIDGKRNSGGAELRFDAGRVFHQKAEVIHRGPVRAFRRRGARFLNDDESAREFQHLQRSRVGHFSAQNSDPELLLRIRIGDDQVYVSDGNAAIVRGCGLSKERSGGSGQKN